MKILIVSATFKEIEPLINNFHFEKLIQHNLKTYSYRNSSIDVLISGVGMVAMAYQLGKALAQHKYDFVFNFGIAGSFNSEIKIGEVVNIVSEKFADFGAEDGEMFLSVFEMGLIDPNQFPFKDKRLPNNLQFTIYNLQFIKRVKGITVNTVSGNENSIKKMLLQFPADVETMEGAAFHFVCLSEKIPFAQIKSISNFVEKRNKKNWNIPLALENLSLKAIEIINGFTKFDSISNY